jgi:hypothetical protein
VVQSSRSECFRRDFRQNCWQKTDFALAHKNGTGAILAGVCRHYDTRRFSLGYHRQHQEHADVLIKDPVVTGVLLGQTVLQGDIPCLAYRQKQQILLL